MPDAAPNSTPPSDGPRDRLKARGQTRKKELALIHIAKKDLGWDDDTYRDMLHAWTGKRSSGRMNQAERQRVIENMRAAGFEQETPKKERPTKERSAPEPAHVAPGDKPQTAKIKALWLALWKQGKVENPSLPSLNRFVQRMTTVDHVDWLPPDQANTVIEALKGWKTR